MISERIHELRCSIESVREKIEASHNLAAIRKYDIDLIWLLETKDVNDVLYMHVRGLQ
jgi:hypothetical protein